MRIAFSNLPVLFRQCGLDFYIIDGEHGAFDYREFYQMICAARLAGGIETIVRLPSNARKDIIKLMDMGADSLLLPMTNGAEEIRQVVKYAKYSPLGERGISTMRAHTLYNPPPLKEYMRTANARTRVYAQIETVARRGAYRQRSWKRKGSRDFLWGRTTCRTPMAAWVRRRRRRSWKRSERRRKVQGGTKGERDHHGERGVSSACAGGGGDHVQLRKRALSARRRPAQHRRPYQRISKMILKNRDTIVFCR